MKKALMGMLALVLICAVFLFQPEHQAFAVKQSGLTKQIGEKDNTKTILVGLGTTLVINLDGNATTGYCWQVASVSGQSIKQMGDVDYASEPGLGVGRGGTFTVRFSAVKLGVSIIKMQYLRTWEKDKPPAKTFTVRVEVVK